MNGMQKLGLAAAAALLSLAPAAFATEANLELTSGGSNVAYGVYIGPYTLTVNGVSTQMVCDDFADDSYLNETWTANLYSFSSLTNTKWGNQPGLYDQAAWLTLHLFSSPNAKESDAIQYALWAVFDGSDVKTYLGSNGGASFYNDSSDADGVAYWLNLAGQQNYTAGEFSNFQIYTPNTQDPMSCSTAGQNCPPQEFLLPNPEPRSILLLATGLAALLLLRRRANRRLA